MGGVRNGGYRRTGIMIYLQYWGYKSKQSSPLLRLTVPPSIPQTEIRDSDHRVSNEQQNGHNNGRFAKRWDGSAFEYHQDGEGLIALRFVSKGRGENPESESEYH